MKVYYKLDVNDIKQLIAEKYGVSTRGIGTCMTPEGPGFMVDMSKTETPEPVPFKDYVSPFLSKKEEPAPEKKEPEKQEEVEDDEADRYGEITDGILEDYIKQGYTIPQICGIYKLTDSKYSARLYKRAEKFRSEGASRGRRRHQEETQGTEQGADRPGLEVLPVPGMP